MTLRIRTMPAHEYASRVLPLTHELWGGSRTLESYVGRMNALAETPYGKRDFHTVALASADGDLLASFKRYDRAARIGNRTLRAIGIGAVFTAPELRGRGYASAMLGLALDAARDEGIDLAFLFSDIRPQFYADLGFAVLPSRTISLRAANVADARIRASRIEARDWSVVRACHEECNASRAWALERTARYWSWVRAVIETQQSQAGRIDAIARGPRGSVAYVLGRREPASDAYVMDEFGYRGESGEILAAGLLRYAAGDLRRIAGWLPPSPARALLPRGSVRRRTDSILMAAPLSPSGAAFIKLASSTNAGDAVWNTDHI